MRVVLAGGGTGGHLFPAIALAEELALRGGSEVLFVGTARGIEARVVPKEGYPLELIDVGGLKGRGVFGLFRGLLRVPRALYQSRRILGRFRPDLVIGVGGYASGPVVLAAALSGTTTAILEQNSVPGITNRLLGRAVRRVYTSFEASHPFFPAEKVALLGNPIRARLRAELADDVALQQKNAVPQQTPALLICGGSQGARPVNDLCVAALALLHAEGRAPRIVHQTGPADHAAVAERYRAAGIEAEVRDFIDDMATAYRGADLVVARAGATTLAELTAIGRASILIPFPQAADDHQTKNAEALAAAGAAWVFPQKDLSPRALADAIHALASDEKVRSRMAAAAREKGRPGAAAAIVDALIALLAEGGRKRLSSPAS